MALSRFVKGMLSVSLMIGTTGVVFGQTTTTGSGQAYPSKPIRIIAGNAGGGGDFTARQLAQGMSGPMGQQVIIDNRVALISAEAVAKAPPDGYTLLLQGSILWVSPLLRQVPYDVVRDFSPISLLVREVTVLVVHPSVPVKSVKELIALAKARPGEIDYGSGSTGAPSHLAFELFKAMAGVNIMRVPYKGDAPLLTALLSGEVQVIITDASSAAPHIKSGKMKALAVTTAQPSALAPGLPTVAATGLPGYETGGMSGIWAPAKTPGAIISRLNQEIVRVLNLPDVKERFFNNGVETVGSSPEELAAIIKSDTTKMSKVIKDAGIKLD